MALLICNSPRFLKLIEIHGDTSIQNRMAERLNKNPDILDKNMRVLHWEL